MDLNANIFDSPNVHATIERGVVICTNKIKCIEKEPNIFPYLN